MDSYCLWSLVALDNWIRMSVICGHVLPWGATGSGPELAGGKKGTSLRVLKMAGVMVRYSRSSAPSPRWDWTEAALVLSCRCTSVMVSYQF